MWYSNDFVCMSSKKKLKKKDLKYTVMDNKY